MYLLNIFVLKWKRCMKFDVKCCHTVTPFIIVHVKLDIEITSLTTNSKTHNVWWHMTPNLEKIFWATLCWISWSIELLNAHLELVLTSLYRNILCLNTYSHYYPEQDDYKSHLLVYWFNNQITFNSTNANPMSALIAILNKPDSDKCNLKPSIVTCFCWHQ